MKMRLERVFWIAVVTVLVATLVSNFLSDKALRLAVMPRGSERVYAALALESFSTEQVVDKSAVLKDFYIMYVGLSDRSCIHLVPKQNVTGGATTYCYTTTTPIRLINIDREGE
jgi:hypothetical protein